MLLSQNDEINKSDWENETPLYNNTNIKNDNELSLFRLPKEIINQYKNKINKLENQEFVNNENIEIIKN